MADQWSNPLYIATWCAFRKTCIWRWLVDKRSIRVLVGPSCLAIFTCVYDNRSADRMSLVVDSNSIQSVTFVKLVPLPEQALARKKEKMLTISSPYTIRCWLQ